MAMQAPPEKLAYVAMLNPGSGPDALAVVDVDPASRKPTAASSASSTCRPAATSCTISAGTRAAPASARTHPHPHMERRYLVVPGLRSSRIHILDTKPDPRQPRLVKSHRARGSGANDRLHAAAHDALRPRRHLHERARRRRRRRARRHLRARSGARSTSAGRWEQDRGPQHLAYDFWWHLGHDTMITSEWGTPNMVENGVNPELLLAGKYGHQLHVWDLRKRRHQPGARPRRGAADGAGAAPGARPDQGVRLRRRRRLAEGSLRVDLALASQGDGNSDVGDHEGHRDPGRAGRSGRSAAAAARASRRCRRWSPTSTSRSTTGSCTSRAGARASSASTTCPIRSSRKLTGSVHLGGIVRRARASAAAPTRAERRAADGRGQPRRAARLLHQLALRSRGTSSSIPTASAAGWRSSTPTRRAACDVDPEFFVEFDGLRPHQVRLEGGDASSDSYCFS